MMRLIYIVVVERKDSSEWRLITMFNVCNVS